jgi:GWxTD domain-containing protein
VFKARCIELAGVLAVGLGSLGCTALGPAPSLVQEVLDGPLRWLLTPSERKELVSLRSRSELDAWQEAVWARRNPDPSAEVNVREELFERRVSDADRLYQGELGLRGSMTARGRALILLGPPSGLRRGQRAAPKWAPSDDGAATRNIVAEAWTYPPQRLPAVLVERLAERGDTELTLRFVEEHGLFRLVEGEAELRLAAEGWIVDPTIVPRNRARDALGRAPGRPTGPSP